jgi:pyrrolysine biosynthesis protein PylC
MVQMLGEIFTGNFKDSLPGPQTRRGVVFEHIRVSSEVLETSGEHIMAQNEPLYLRPNFFGADEAITNFDQAKKQWVATLIVLASSRGSALAKEERVLGEIFKNQRRAADPEV